MSFHQTCDLKEKTKHLIKPIFFIYYKYTIKKQNIFHFKEFWMFERTQTQVNKSMFMSTRVTKILSEENRQLRHSSDNLGQKSQQQCMS